MKDMKKMTLIVFILMFCTSVLGFSNIARGFMLMGYSASLWYIIAGLTFFVPFALICAEFGMKYKDKKGGIFSWMAESTSEKFAFIGTLMWYGSYIIWMLSITTLGIIVAPSYGFLGYNIIGSMNTGTIGMIAILVMIGITFISVKGLKQLTKFTSIGGIAVLSLNFILLFGGFLVLSLNGFHLATPIGTESIMNGVSIDFNLFNSPNPSNASIFGILAFIVFAIFAYGGVESIGGLADKVNNPEKNVKKGLLIGAIFGIVLYFIGIITIGFFLDWNTVIGAGIQAQEVTLANITYVVIGTLGYELSNALNLGNPEVWQQGFVMFTGIGMTLAFLGALFTLSYSPLKQLIEGAPKGLLADSLNKHNKHGMPYYAMWVQAVIVIGFIIAKCWLPLLLPNPDTVNEFITAITLMTNVAMTLPICFIIFAYIKFRNKQLHHGGTLMIKNNSIAITLAVLAFTSVLFANVFAIIEPILNQDYQAATWMIIGPVIFIFTGLLLFHRYEKKMVIN